MAARQSTSKLFSTGERWPSAVEVAAAGVGVAAIKVEVSRKTLFDSLPLIFVLPMFPN
jgi:hypothetical protein